jgi:hypothetical protein
LNLELRGVKKLPFLMCGDIQMKVEEMHESVGRF